MHPDYLSTRYALEREGVETIAIQHHHAHLAACLAEHGETGRAVGAIFDGTGYGPDGTVWGGEILCGDLGGFERAGHLVAVRMPGGEAAIREPWRMARAWLGAALEAEPQLPETLSDSVEPDDWSKVGELAASGLASPVTTSAGRLFDAAAALCGIRSRVVYEGQAAIEFEAACDLRETGSYPVVLSEEDGNLVLDPRIALRALSDEVAADVDASLAAARFHNSIAEVTAAALLRAAEMQDVDLAVLSGGVFQNRLLLERTLKVLETGGLRTLIPQRLPPNDGGISYGQAAVAAARS